MNIMDKYFFVFWPFFKALTEGDTAKAEIPKILVKCTDEKMVEILSICYSLLDSKKPFVDFATIQKFFDRLYKASLEMIRFNTDEAMTKVLDVGREYYPINKYLGKYVLVIASVCEEHSSNS